MTRVLAQSIPYQKPFGENCEHDNLSVQNLALLVTEIFEIFILNTEIFAGRPTAFVSTTQSSLSS